MNKEDLWTKERLQAERPDYTYTETVHERFAAIHLLETDMILAIGCRVQKDGIYRWIRDYICYEQETYYLLDGGNLWPTKMVHFLRVC